MSGRPDRQDPIWLLPDSTLHLENSTTLLADDLSILPLPLVDPATSTRRTVNFVFADAPNEAMLRAAAIVSSWLGMHSPEALPRIAVNFGTIPEGNAIIFMRNGSKLLPWHFVSRGSAIAIAPNPRDPLGKLVVVSGDNDPQMIQSAQAIADDQLLKSGQVMNVSSYSPPPPRPVDGSTTWMQPGQSRSFIGEGDDGSAHVKFRLAPDLYTRDRQRLHFALHTTFKEPVNQTAALAFQLNDIFLGTAPLPSDRSAFDQTIRYRLHSSRRDNQLRIYVLPSEWQERHSPAEHYQQHSYASGSRSASG